MPMPTLLITRPEDGARRFAQAVGAAGLGLRIVIAPLMRIVPVAHDSARLMAAPVVVLTSRAAVPAVGPGAGRLALCVGEGTAAAARTAGFSVQVGATGEASGLLPLIAACRDKAGAQGAPLHARGRHVAAVLPVEGIVVYDQQPQPLSAAGRAALTGPEAVFLPLFSPRSARLAALACAEAGAGGRAPLHPFAISANAAAEWGRARAEAGGTAGAGARVPVAARPDGEAMIALLAGLVGGQSLGAPG